MAKTHRIVFLTYNGAELLDLTGPSAVFATANRVSGKPLYEIVVASPEAASTSHSCGITLSTLGLDELRISGSDTVLIVGADAKPLVTAMANVDLKSVLNTAANDAGRFGSICSGVFILAAAGLLSQKTVATHWSATERLTSRFPAINCNADAMYVNDGNLWTSAGVTTGIDMALAILECDHGAAVKMAVARQLVVYSHRPGHQSQFSDLLAAQSKEDGRFSGLITWLRESTGAIISVENMADHVGMSPRTFYRQFMQSFGQSPAKFFEGLRLDAARSFLEANQSVATVATKVGFLSESAFRAAFKARYGLTPQLYRETWRAR
jgi:transcriptional regulator GlxA family with amidase domain